MFPLPIAFFALISFQTPVTGAPNPQVSQPELALIQSEVNAFAGHLYKEARASGHPPDRATLNRVIGDYIATLLKDVRIAAIPAKESGEWAQLFESAGKDQEATALEESSVGYHSTQLMFTYCDLIPQMLKAGKDQEVIFLLRHAPDLMPRQLGMIGEAFYDHCLELRYDKTKPEFVAKGIRILEGKLDNAPHETMAEKNSMADNVYVGFEMKLLRMKYDSSRDPKVVAEMKSLRARYAKSKSTDAFGNGPTHEIDDFLSQTTVMDRPAPELVFQQSIGDFKGLGFLKGKVVLLDFMAHWCGPCKAAFPGIRKIRDEMGSALEVVSISSFYGYYGPKTGISRKDEFADMHEFVKEYGIRWPVIFDEKQETQARYGVSAIPYLVVLDRKGIVRSIQVGHTAEGELELEKLVKKLAAERT